MRTIPSYVQSAVVEIRLQNRLMEHPLSLLYVNAYDMDRLVAWESWLRRVVIFSRDQETHYQLVAAAMGLDFYSRFNLRLSMAEWNTIPEQVVAWPFNIIYVCLDRKVWGEGLVSPQGWATLLSIQATVSEEFLLIAEGPREMVNAVRSLITEAGPIGGSPLNLEPLSAHRFQSLNGEYGFRMWRVSHDPVRKARVWLEEELEAVTDVMQWGEED